MRHHRNLLAPMLAALLLPVPALVAQAGPTAPLPARRLEFRIPAGAFLPTGALRGALADARVTAAQLSWRLAPQLAITGTFAWARSRDLVGTDSRTLDVFTSDVGVELRSAPSCAGCRVSVSGFGGIGAGMQSYDTRGGDVATQHHPAAYAAAGGTVSMGRVGLRIELRDYVAGFRSQAPAGNARAHNDMVLLGSLSINFGSRR